MASEISYGEDFRCIGQALEARNVRSFGLKRAGDWYILEGVPPAEDSLRSKLHKFRMRFRSGSDAESLILALADVEELSKKGKARRFRPGRMADFTKLSNALRTIGHYLESKRAKLIELQVRPLTITLSYKDSDGKQQVEDRTIRSFHSLFLELCDKRAEDDEGAKAQHSAG